MPKKDPFLYSLPYKRSHKGTFLCSNFLTVGSYSVRIKWLGSGFICLHLLLDTFFFNFQIDFQDLMESFPLQARKLLDQYTNDGTSTKVWSGFLLSHWDLQTVHPEIIALDDRIEDDDTDDDSDIEDGTIGQLVDLS